MSIEYKPIEPTDEDTSNKTPSPDSESMVYKLIAKYQKLFADCKDNELRRRDFLDESCIEVLNLKESHQDFFVDEILKTETNISRKKYLQRLSTLRKKRLEDANDNQAVAIPEVDIIESHLISMFDVRYNVISNKYEYRNTCLDNKFEEFDIYTILRTFRKRHIEASSTFILEIIKSNFTPKHNPIDEYFKALPTWDGTDYIEKLATYIIVHDNDRERFNRHFKKMFVRIIAAAYGRAVNKRCMVFVGGQDAGKSTFVRWLIPKFLKEYYSEDCDFGNKDGLISLTSNFIIALDEIANLPRNDINTIKSIMSKDTIKVRLPYDRRDSMLVRRSSFIASTNDEEFLTDPTGNVRWICFLLKGRGITWSYKKDIEIDKVWAQAYYLMNNGFAYDMDRVELEENELSNMQFMTKTTEIELIPRFYMPGTKGDQNVMFWQATDFYNDLIKRFEGTKLNINLINIGRALRAMKFQRDGKRIKDTGLTRYGYYIALRDQSLWKIENNITEQTNNTLQPNTDFDNL